LESFKITAMGKLVISETEVLVVGAGPTGLTAAAALSHWGVKVRVIDKAPAPSGQSKALGVQAGTLECLRDVFGPELPEKMIREGFPVKTLHLRVAGQRPLDIDTSVIPSIYNFVLVLEQSKTEGLLTEVLTDQSLKVERSCELLETREEGDGVVSRFRSGDGREEMIRSQFVLGCDGAHSLVRHQAGIDFQGKPYSADFILGDVRLEWPCPDGEIQIYLGNQGVAAAFPIKGDHRFRFILIPKEKTRVGSPAISPEEFARTAQALCPLPLKIVESLWLARFRVHHRRARRFRKGRLFLLGDAAHIHSPVGGQGMNTGIQDAVNLSFKISRVLRQGAPPELLNQYEVERVPVADSILKNTDKATRTVLLGANPISQKIAFYLAPRLGRFSFLQKKILRSVSQIEVARREIEGRRHFGE
jgi:3-(3-hydroxy-phenyl)propionate hydroxylase